MRLTEYRVLSGDARPTGNSVMVLEGGEARFLAEGGRPCTPGEAGASPLYVLPVPEAGALGEASFRKAYGLKYALYGGSMAQGISSEAMVIALGRAGCMGAFGAGGLSLARVEQAIDRIAEAIPGLPYLMNVLHIHGGMASEMALIDLYIRKGVPGIEASAFIEMSPALVRYRASGLTRRPDGRIEIAHRIVAKVSRTEIAELFCAPPPEAMLGELLSAGLITPVQAELARQLPMADDITAEADSGGHTDNRPLVSLLPVIRSCCARAREKHGYPLAVRVGAAGGIGTPQAVAAAFAMGAAYVVTGSVNQSCVEAGTSEGVKAALAGVSMTDVVMAPCADMFEMGGRVQVMRKATLYPMNAQKLYDLYTRYAAYEEIPEADRGRVEKSIFRCPAQEVWENVEAYFQRTDPRQLEAARRSPKIRMALMFRWYLGSSSRWAIEGDPARRMDMQIWCGPSLGAFNEWCRGTELERPENRHVDDVALRLLGGAARLELDRLARLAGVRD